MFWLLLALQAAPLPPTQVSFGETATTRFEFAPIPEHVFVRGRPEKVQMGIWQTDPTNRWTPGDQTRASGWTSKRTTRLIDVATNQPATMFTYNSLTGELTYGGVWSGDVTVRLETGNGVSKSNDFRIRVLAPTVVYGKDAAAVAAANGWTAFICNSDTMTFVTCRQNFKGGGSDIAPLVLYITPGTYSGQDFYLGGKSYNYILGEPGMTSTLAGDGMGPAMSTMFTVRNLTLNNTNLSGGGRSPKQTINLSNIKQCCEDYRVQNGVVNANGTTVEPWLVNVWNFVSIGMGNAGNTNHAFYIEGRAKGKFEINNSQCRGAKGSSCFKTDMAYYSVRNSLICTTQDCTSVGAGTPEKGMTTHTMLDVPGAGTIIVYNNHFKVWKNHRDIGDTGYSGSYTPPVFIRQRQAFRGSDIPWYPDVTYEPPVSNSNVPRGDPGGGWSGLASTFVNPAFWADVATKPDMQIFNHYISFNVMEMLPNSVGEQALLRDDGTYSIEAVAQFGPGRALRAPENWRERGKNFLHGNTYLGYAGVPPAYQLKMNQAVVEIEPGAQWPRTKPEQFPTATDLTVLPLWFKL
jgi:hypothetical protein